MYWRRIRTIKKVPTNSIIPGTDTGWIADGACTFDRTIVGPNKVFGGDCPSESVEDPAVPEDCCCYCIYVWKREKEIFSSSSSSSDSSSSLSSDSSSSTPIIISCGDPIITPDSNLTFDVSTSGDVTIIDNFSATCPGGNFLDGAIQIDFPDLGCCYEISTNLTWNYSCDDSCGPVAQQYSLDLFTIYSDCDNISDTSLHGAGGAAGPSVSISGTGKVCSNGSSIFMQYQFIQDGGSCTDICSECVFGPINGSITITKLGSC